MTGRSVARTLGRVLKIEREQVGATPEQFAQRLGLPLVTYQRVEDGETGTRLSTLERIAAGLGCTVSELLRQAER